MGQSDTTEERDMMEIVGVGDVITIGCYCHGVSEARYGVEGDSVMNSQRIAELSGELFAEAKRWNKLGWLTEDAISHLLAVTSYDGEAGHAASAAILARAHITWHMVCARNS